MEINNIRNETILCGKQTTCSIIPRRIDCRNIRDLRQIENNLLVENSIISKDMISFQKHTNAKEVERVIKETGSSLDDILNECHKNSIMLKILSGRVSKNASRQGTKDELTQIAICDGTSRMFDIRITKNLPAIDYRPTKTGEIVCKADMKHKGIRRDECLKSFDAQITGNIVGWVFAKVVFGSGGHQDNVFEEADTLCDWVCKYRKDTKELYVILIDTDQYDKIHTLKEKYTSSQNILIVNHYEFQEYIIHNYSV